MKVSRAAVAVVLVLFLPAILFAATEAQKQAAINKGLAFLAASQNWGDGWNQTGYPVADTGAVVLAFEGKGYLPGPTGYNDVVRRGVEYILSNGVMTGTGVSFSPFWEESYIVGLAVPAIAKSGYAPGATYTGPGALNGMTYGAIVQSAVDRIAAGQNTPGYAGQSGGGWGYDLWRDNSRADNSTAQWPTTALLYAPTMGATVPVSTLNNLKPWINSIQDPVSGGSGYDVFGSIVTESKTGGLLMEMTAAGGYGLGNAQELAALAYLNANWQNGAASWNGNFGHPYAMWSIYKGLELTIGLGDTTHITNLHPAGPMDVGDTWNWWEDYCDYLVNTQDGSGAWGGYWYWPSFLTTAWDINILNAVDIPGPVIPEPSSLAIWGCIVGIAAGARWLRRRKTG